MPQNLRHRYGFVGGVDHDDNTRATYAPAPPQHTGIGRTALPSGNRVSRKLRPSHHPPATPPKPDLPAQRMFIVFYETLCQQGIFANGENLDLRRRATSFLSALHSGAVPECLLRSVFGLPGRLTADNCASPPATTAADSTGPREGHFGRSGIRERIAGMAGEFSLERLQPVRGDRPCAPAQHHQDVRGEV